MAGRWRWRAAMLATVALVFAAMPLRAMAGGGPRDDGDRARGGTTVDRINPDLDGDRIVFTQVEQRRGVTSRAVWSRDLASGRETLVAEVGTGEPFPAASGPWTVWSEQGATQHLVRAKSLGDRRVLDVFATDLQPFELVPTLSSEVLSVDVSGATVAVANSTSPDTTGGEADLVRVSLPSLQRTFVDVPSTGDPSRARVAQSGATSVVSRSSSVLFSIVDGAGNVIAAPTGGDCSPTFGGSRLRPAIDGARVAAAAVCFFPTLVAFVPAIVTCTLPCGEVTATPLGSSTGLPSWVAVSGNRVAWSTQDGGGSALSFGVYVLDLDRGGPPELVHRTSGAAGPKVTLSGDRLAWDQTVIRDGSLRRAVYVRNLATGVTTVLEPGVRNAPIVPEATGPLRLDPDVRAGRLAYTEVARDGSSAGVWTRSLRGGATLVSAAATDGTTARLGDGWLAWNTRDPGAVVERVVATTGPGAPLVDVYTTDLAPFGFAYSPEFPARASVDVGGARAVVSALTVDPAQPAFCCPQPAVFAKDLPAGPLQYLAPVAPPPGGGFSQAAFGRTNGTYTVAADFAFPAVSVDLFDAGGTLLRQLPIPSTSPFGPSCHPSALDISATQVVVATTCFGPGEAGTALLACTLPCTGGFTDRIPVPNVVGDFSPGFPQPPTIQSLSVDGRDAVVSYSVARSVGTPFVQTTVIERYDLRRGTGPVAVATALGTVSPPQVSAGVITWSVDSWDGGRSGTVYVHDIGRRRTTAL